jgi:hypothetical protein
MNDSPGALSRKACPWNSALSIVYGAIGSTSSACRSTIENTSPVRLMVFTLMADMPGPMQAYSAQSDKKIARAIRLSRRSVIAPASASKHAGG